MRLALGSALVAALLITAPSPASASTIVIDFESPAAADCLDAGHPLTDLCDGDPVTNQFSNLTFSNATLITALFSLNEIEFPPSSPDNVVYDDGGAIEIVFASPLFKVGGYFNYNAPLILAAYNGATHLGDISSLFSSNNALTGQALSSVNEFMQVSSLLGITSVTITGALAGGSFTLDDLTLNDGLRDSAPVPEPSTFVLMLGGAAAAFIGKRRKDARRNNR